MRAADAVDLARIGRAHRREQHAIAQLALGRQIARVEVQALRRAAAHQRAGNRRQHALSSSAAAASTYVRPLAASARACRRCRARARRPCSRARDRRLPSSRARGLRRARLAACSRGTTQTPSSSATIRSPGLHQRAGADDRHVHAAERLLDRALRRHVSRPDRKAASPSDRGRRARRRR